MAVKDLADIEAIERIDLADRGLPKSTYAALQRQAQSTPKSMALRFVLDAHDFQRTFDWTYEELFADITRTGNALSALGAGPKDVVAFILPNLPETHFTIWGGEAAGIVMAINPLLDGEQTAELIRAAGAKVLVTLAPTPGSDLWEKIAERLPQLPTVEHVVWVSMAPYVSTFKSLALRTIGSQAKRKHPALKIHDLRHLMQKQPGDRLKTGRVIEPHETSSYFCTGGTTGLPKIAMRSHGSEVFNAWAMGQGMQPRAPGKVLFCGLPLFHVNGQMVTGLNPWTHGDQVIIGTPQGYRGPGVIPNFWAMVEHFEVNYFSGVPTVYAGLLQQPVGRHRISSLEYALCGAAPMSVELFRNFESTSGVNILEGYGLTEGACTSSCNPPSGERRIGSIGLRIPYQAMRAVILDNEGNYLRNAGVDEVGVIAISGPNVFKGYLEPSHNKGLWIDIDQQRWINTGDLGRQDAEGYFWLTGRKKELIIRGGHNIDPKQIEESLQTHPQVALVAAVGSPDAYAGEVPVAYVQPAPGAAPTAAELLAFAEAHIHERAAVPKRIEVIAALPLTAVGKISKPELQKLEISHAVQQEAHQLQAHGLQVNVIQDSKRGLVAQVYSNSHRRELRDALARYTFAHDWLDTPNP